MNEPAALQGTLARGATLTVIGRFVGRGILLLVPVLIARQLGAEALGIYAIAWSLLRLGQQAGEFGLSNTVLKFGSDAGADRHKTALAVVLSASAVILLSMLTIAILWAAMPALMLHVFDLPDVLSLFRFALWSILFMAASSLLATATSLTLDLRYQVLVLDILQPICFVGLLFPALLVYPHVLSIFACLFVSYLAATIASIALISRLFSPLQYLRAIHRADQLTVLKQMSLYTLPVGVASFMVRAIADAGVLFLGVYATIEQVGIYQATFQLTIVFTLLAAGFGSALSPLFAHLFAQHNLRELGRLYQLGSKWLLYAGIPVIAVFVVAPAATLTTLFGAGFDAGAIVLVCISIGKLVDLMTGNTASMLLMTGHERSWSMLIVVNLFVTVGLHLLLTPRFQLIGAALVAVVSILINKVGGAILVHQRLGLLPLSPPMWKGFAAGLASAVLVGILKHVVHGDSMLALVAFGFGSLLAFVATLLVLGLEDEDRHFLEALLPSAAE